MWIMALDSILKSLAGKTQQTNSGTPELTVEVVYVR